MRINLRCAADASANAEPGAAPLPPGSEEDAEPPSIRAGAPPLPEPGAPQPPASPPRQPAPCARRLARPERLRSGASARATRIP